MSKELIAYDKYKNLKIAANEIGISWHTLYSMLKKQGVSVVGDKLRYGSDRDRLSSLAEYEFSKLVPSAKNMNEVKWQHKYDFMVNGKKVDVKCSTPRKLSKKYENKSWSFSFKKQSLICDFVCCMCMSEEKIIQKIVLVPSEFFKGLQTISIAASGNSKWLDYEINGSDLEEFFMSL